MNKRTNITGILKGEAELPLYFFALLPFSLVYSLAMRVRAWMYRAGILRRRRLPCKVISVGNITAGGTGKTPTVIMLTGKLIAAGIKTAVVTRGYGGKMEGGMLVVSDADGILAAQTDAGDEAYLLAAKLPGVPVIMCSDRYKGGMLAVERFGAEVVLLDDAYQHLAVERDLDILLLDSAHPFGNGHILPMGYLREPVTAVERADAVMLTRADRVGPGGLDGSMKRIAGLNPSAAVMTAAHVPVRIYGHPEGAEMGFDSLSGVGVFGFSGIGDPASFALILKQLNAKILKFREFSDHHEYTQPELAALAGQAMRSGAGFMVTTEKDAVKLGGFDHPGIRLAVVAVEMAVVTGEELLDWMIRDRVLQR